MTLRLAGKIAWVTGGSRGIGYAIAEDFARAGATVAISSRRSEGVAAATTAINEIYPGMAHGYTCHVGRRDDVEKTLAAITADLGPPSVLVNNAGTSPYFGPLIDAPEGLWDKTFEVNLKGPFWATQVVAKQLIGLGQPGSIINIASIQGQVGAPLQGVYGMTKAAVISMTQTFALELGPSGIRVNAIAPGLVETRLASALTGNPEFSSLYTDRAALHRFGQPHEIAGAAVFLAGDEASYLSGQTIVIDGGYMAS